MAWKKTEHGLQYKTKEGYGIFYYANKIIKNGSCFYEVNERVKYHIVRLIEDEQEPLIVYKYFGIHKRRWFYEIKYLWIFNNFLESGIYYYKINGEVIKI